MTTIFLLLGAVILVLMLFVLGACMGAGDADRDSDELMRKLGLDGGQ